MENWFLENTINVSSSGFCLLEAFQVGFLADHKRFIKLETIKNTVLNEFKKLITLKSSLEPRLRELVMADALFSSEKEKFGVITSSSSFDMESNLIKVNSFKLIDYLENGTFNIDVVDFVPLLLAEGFYCELNVFQYDSDIDEKKTLQSDGNLFHGSKFSPGGKSSENSSSSFSKIPEINLVYLRNQMHYITKTKVKLSAKTLSSLQSENKFTKSIIPALSNDNFYSKISRNFQNNKNVLYLNQIVNSKKLILRVEEERRLQLKTLKLKPVIETDDYLDFFIERIKDESLKSLFDKFTERFGKVQELKDFINKGELFPTESEIFNRFLIKTQIICSDLHINPMTIQGKNLVKILALIFKLGSLRCLYSEIRIFWSSDLKKFKSIRLRPQGIVVDLEFSKFDVIIAYNRNNSNFFYSSIINNIYRDLEKNKFKTPIDSSFDQTITENDQNESFIDCMSVSVISIMLFFVLSMIILMVSTT